MQIRIRRVYAPPAPSEGRRILVDRLWPRGISRAEAGIDGWIREVAPSDALRRWYRHAPERWEEFRTRYFRELEANPDGVRALREAIGNGRATLLFAAREERLNNAAALREYLSARPARRPAGGRGDARTTRRRHA